MATRFNVLNWAAMAGKASANTDEIGEEARDYLLQIFESILSQVMEPTEALMLGCLQILNTCLRSSMLVTSTR